MSYYQLNRQEILQKSRKDYSKEKAAEYYFLNKEAIKKRQKVGTKIWQKKKKNQKKEHQKNYCKKLKAYKDELLLEKARGGKKSD